MLFHITLNKVYDIISFNVRGYSGTSLILSIMHDYDCRKVAYDLAVPCNLYYGFSKCSFPGNAIDVDLKVITQKGIPIYKKDFKTQMNKCSPRGSAIRPYLDFK